MNLQGQSQEFGPAISFDAKGVEFESVDRELRRAVRRNWFIPMAAMTMRGHVVVTFFVHKDGRITDVSVAKPSPIDAFTLSAERHPGLQSHGRFRLEYRTIGRSSPSRSTSTKSRRAMTMPSRVQVLGMLIILAALVELALARACASAPL